MYAIYFFLILYFAVSVCSLCLQITVRIRRNAIHTRFIVFFPTKTLKKMNSFIQLVVCHMRRKLPLCFNESQRDN